MTYTYEYDETGGYDCMTGAFIVEHPDGSRVVAVDLGDFGQGHCEWPPQEAHKAAAEEIAKLITEALNKRLDAASSEGEKK